MLKVSGLMNNGKIGIPDKQIIDAMPDAPSKLEYSNDENISKIKMLDSSIKNNQIFELPISLIHRSPYQVRVVADNEYIETLMASVAQSGIISPIIVRMLDSSIYEVIAGHHRLDACRKLNYTTIPVIVRNMSNSEAACALVSDNFVRKELSDYERYKHAKLLKDNDFCKSYNEIGKVLGISRQLVGFLFAFDDYPQDVKNILELTPQIIGATQANELRNIANKEPILFTEAISLLANGEIRQNQINNWINTKLNESIKPEFSTLYRNEFKFNKQNSKSSIKLTYTDKEAKIQSQKLNIDILKKLIEENIDDLID